MTVTEAVKQFAWSRDFDGQRVLVAVSGGADSIALLHTLTEKPRPLFGATILAAHLNHGIRGEEADADANFVRGYCEAHGLACRLGCVDVPAYAREHRLSLETAARECRYAFLRQAARELRADYIATAHHADDQAETVLMRILRGTGLDGLAAMRPVSGDIIRPLLNVRRADIERYCAEHGLHPRHDASNDAAEATRNRLRLELLPQLAREYNPAVVDALCRLADIAADEQEYVKAQVDNCYNEAVKGDTISRAAYNPLPRVLRLGVLRRMMTGLGVNDACSREHYERLDEFTRKAPTGKRLTLPRKLLAVNVYGKIVFRRGAADAGHSGGGFGPEMLNVPGVTRWGDCVLTVTATDDPRCGGRGQIVVDADAVGESWAVGSRWPGARLGVNGGTQSVKQLMIDRKIPRSERDRVPVIFARDKVLWVAGVRQSDFGKANDDSKRMWLVALTKNDDEGTD